ncbi:MAG: hypothetical protein KF708_24200, partial [Pirellulales bacterium]|nr:hypothetical protein [Pirellulales bacterium]
YAYQSDFVVVGLMVMLFTWVWSECVSRLNSLKIEATWRRCAVLFVGATSIPLALALPISGGYLLFEVAQYGMRTIDATRLATSFMVIVASEIVLGVLMRIAVPPRMRLIPQNADLCQPAEITNATQS